MTTPGKHPPPINPIINVTHHFIVYIASTLNSSFDSSSPTTFRRAVWPWDGPIRHTPEHPPHRHRPNTRRAILHIVCSVFINDVRLEGGDYVDPWVDSQNKIGCATLLYAAWTKARREETDAGIRRDIDKKPDAVSARLVNPPSFRLNGASMYYAV